jgi:hypothetical protein
MILPLATKDGLLPNWIHGHGLWSHFDKKKLGYVSGRFIG